MDQKELLRVKLKETEKRIKGFEDGHRSTFAEFKRAWEAGRVSEQYSYAVERDYWEWESAVVDLDRLKRLLDGIS